MSNTAEVAKCEGAGVCKGVAQEVAGVTEKAIDKGFALLDQIAAKLGLTVDYLWPFMVKEQIVQFVVSCLFLVFGLVGMVVVSKYFDYKRISDSDGGGVKNVLIAVVGAVLIVTAFVGFMEFWSNLPNFLNPEYHALKDLMKMVK